MLGTVYLNHLKDSTVVPCAVAVCLIGSDEVCSVGGVPQSVFGLRKNTERERSKRMVVSGRIMWFLRAVFCWWLMQRLAPTVSSDAVALDPEYKNP